jgi:protein associated with RNAse G/E
VLDAEFDHDIEHDFLGRIDAGTISTEFYWLDRWYNVFRFSEAEGKLKSFYCNVNMPPTFDGNVLTYVDLDIDVLVQPDFSYQILDLEEFQKNAAHYDYPESVCMNAKLAVDELLELISTRSYPFSD